MVFERIESPGLAHYSYLIGDQKEAVVIDPRRDSEVYVQQAVSRDLRICHILETHRNEDYLVGSLDLAARTGAAIWHADEQWDYEYGRPAQEGQEWQVGRFRLRAIAAPGHTPGMMAYLLHDSDGHPWILFSGDALLAGAVGRVDLLGPERSQEMAGLLYNTIFDKFLPLGDGVIVCPAHGSGSVCGSDIAERSWTTIGLERRYNPRLQHTDRQSFVATIPQAPEKPPYFAQMEKWNLAGPPPLSDLPHPVPLSADDLARQAEEALVLDVRQDLAFNAAHVPGALSIWLDGVPSLAGWFLPYGRPILLVADSGDLDRAVRYLVRLGFDRVAGYLAGGMLSWHEAGRESAATRMVTVTELCADLDAEERPWILDVRGSDELEKDGRLMGAQNIPITQLPALIQEVPRDADVRIFCGSGLRSTIAASILQAQGWENISVVLGGTAGWNSVSCPLDLTGRPRREERWPQNLLGEAAQGRTA